MQARTRRILRQVIPDEYIKEREGSRGEMLDYFEYPIVVNILDEAFEGDWSFNVESHTSVSYTETRNKWDKTLKKKVPTEVNLTEYTVLGRLSATIRDSKGLWEMTERMQYGSCVNSFLQS
jgi:hypothetical protein